MQANLSFRKNVKDKAQGDNNFMQPTPADSQQQNQKQLYRDRNLQLIFGVSLIAVLGVGSVTPAFPQITEALKIPPQNIGLLVTAFTLPTVLLVLLLV